MREEKMTRKKIFIGWIDSHYEMDVEQTNIYKIPSIWKKCSHTPYPIFKKKVRVTIEEMK
jgi:hypothetical protein